MTCWQAIHSGQVMKKTLYDILALEADATPEQIRAAYQRASAELDNEGQHDPNKKVILREAYELLLHPQKRASYDARLARQSSLQAQATSTPAQPEVTEKHAQIPKNWFVPAVLIALLVAALAVWWSVKQKEERNKLKEISAVSEVNPVIVKNRPAAQQSAVSDSSNAGVATGTGIGAGKSAEEIYALRSPSIALISVFSPSGIQVAIGSGVMIEPQVLITNCHVVRSGVQYKAKIGKEVLPATVIMADEEFDLCRLGVPGSTAPPVVLGSTDSLRTGQRVFAIGAPQGLDLTISDGIISSLRTLASGRVIQTTAPISPGSSGGGLFDDAGKLVGIMTFQHKLGQNLNFAVPADWINTMSSRRASNQGVGALTMSSIEGQAQGAPAPAPASAGLWGSWACMNVQTGFSLELSFSRNTQVSGSMNGKRFYGNYALRDRTLSLIGDISLSAQIEQLGETKMLINTDRGGRLACGRTST